MVHAPSRPRPDAPRQVFFRTCEALHTRPPRASDRVLEVEKQTMPIVELLMTVWSILVEALAGVTVVRAPPGKDPVPEARASPAD